MSSAIIFSAASANFFWSTGGATGAAPELELGLELKLEGNGGLGDRTSPWDAECGRALTAVLCFTFWSTCFFSFSDLIYKRRRVNLSHTPVRKLQRKTKQKISFWSVMHNLYDVITKLTGSSFSTLNASTLTAVGVSGPVSNTTSHLKSTCNTTNNVKSKEIKKGNTEDI